MCEQNDQSICFFGRNVARCRLADLEKGREVGVAQLLLFANTMITCHADHANLVIKDQKAREIWPNPALAKPKQITPI